MTLDQSRTRRTRADAQRNRVDILQAAERHFGEGGVTVPLADVARDAGVGSATLYRHFPTRDALLAELLELRVARRDAELKRIRQLSDTGAALEQWLLALEEFFGVFDGLPGPLRGAFLEEHNPLASTCIGYIDHTDSFLEAAQRDGKARVGVRGRDLFLAALALSWVRGSSMADASSPAKLRALVRDGYTPVTAS